MTALLKPLLQDFVSLFYPELCAACETRLNNTEKHICLECRYKLPRTDFHKKTGNPAEQKFWGRAPVFRAASFFYFTKAGRVQTLMHSIKYRNMRDAAVTAGEWFGQELLTEADFASADCIIPVPLHKSRMRKRGYNQSEYFGKGLSAAMKIPLDTSSLKRIRKNETQTKKGRYKRWENVSGIFRCEETEAAEARHILLVDDVITTGATLEACVQAILAVNCRHKISIATLAFATN
jgi:ComF family protein